MELIRRLADYAPDAPLAVAIGNFDGLHRGHRAVLARMQDHAAKAGLVPAVLTFEPHPRQFFKPGAPAFRLERLADKLQHLQATGVQRVFALRFNAVFAALSAEQFLEQVLRYGMQARAVVTGENFAFGAKRGGDTALLNAWGAAHGIATDAVPPVTVGGQVCSSSAVRAALAEGAMETATALLTRPYRLVGRVLHGDKRGRQIGFPTANIQPVTTLMLPRYGVYVVRTVIEGKTVGGVANIGLRPTVGGDTRPRFEVHLFDYEGDLYGKKLAVDLLTHVRAEKRFDSFAELTHQIEQDAHAARQYLQEHPHG
jgi:riboflavin kinase/FMN adenylyltransferase